MFRRRVPRHGQRYVRVVHYQVVRESDPGHRDKLDAPEVVAALARRVIPDDDREHFVAFLLDTQNRVTAVHEVGTGSMSAAIVHPREVLGPAIREGAAHLILAHNHPSGDPTPSKEDVTLTRQLADGARLLGLKVHDHVIIGAGTDAFVSLAARSLL